MRLDGPSWRHRDPDIRPAAGGPKRCDTSICRPGYRRAGHSPCAPARCWSSHRPKPDWRWMIRPPFPGGLTCSSRDRRAGAIDVRSRPGKERSWMSHSSTIRPRDTEQCWRRPRERATNIRDIGRYWGYSSKRTVAQGPATTCGTIECKQYPKSNVHPFEVSIPARFKVILIWSSPRPEI